MADNTANIRVTANEQEVDQLARSVDRLGDELNQTDRQAQGLRGKLLAVAGGMVTAELATRAAQAAIRGLTASFNAYAETNEEVQRSTERLKSSFTDLQRRFGEGVFGDGRAERAMDAFSEAMQNADVEGSDLAQTLAGLLDVTTFLIIAQNRLNQTFPELNDEVGVARDLFRSATNPVIAFGNALKYGGPLAAQLQDRLFGVRGELGKLVDEIKEVETAATNSDFVSQFVLGRFQQGTETARAIAPPEITGGFGGGGETVEERTARAAAEGLAIVQRLNQQNNEELRRLDEAAEAAQERAARQAADARMAELEKQQAFSDLKFQLIVQEHDNRLKQERLLSEQLDALEQERLAKTEARQAEANRILGSAASRLAAFEGKTAKERKKAALETIADILRAEGQALIGKGVGNLIALNPIGAAQIAGGTAMIGAARGISGVGGLGGGGRGGGQATPRQNVQAGSQTIINPTVSFGFVGDRRAAYRDVEEANRRALERT